MGTVEPLYCGHLGDLSCIERCPHFRGKFTLRKYYFGTQQSVLISGVSLFQGCPLRGVPLYVMRKYKPVSFPVSILRCIRVETGNQISTNPSCPYYSRNQVKGAFQFKEYDPFLPSFLSATISSFTKGWLHLIPSSV